MTNWHWNNNNLHWKISTDIETMRKYNNHWDWQNNNLHWKKVAVDWNNNNSDWNNNNSRPKE